MSRSDVKLIASAMSLVRKDTLVEGFSKVALISGGGSGHEYVGFRFQASEAVSGNI